MADCKEVIPKNGLIHRISYSIVLTCTHAWVNPVNLVSKHWNIYTRFPITWCRVYLISFWINGNVSRRNIWECCQYPQTIPGQFSHPDTLARVSWRIATSVCGTAKVQRNRCGANGATDTVGMDLQDTWETRARIMYTLDQWKGTKAGQGASIMCMGQMNRINFTSK